MVLGLVQWMGMRLGSGIPLFYNTFMHVCSIISFIYVGYLVSDGDGDQPYIQYVIRVIE